MPKRQRLPPILRRAARRVADVLPPTARGLLIAGLCALALRQWAFAELDLVLFVIGIAGLVLFGLAILIVSGAAFFLSRRLQDSSGALRLEAGHPVSTGFSLPALERLPLVRIRWSWLEPTGFEVRPRVVGRELSEEVVAGHRGQSSGLRRRIVVEDAFGLCRVAWERSTTTPALALPDLGRLRHATAVPSFASAEGLPHPAGSPEGDRMEIRRYAPGDSPRHILWKTYARTHTLNVRTPERSVDRARRTVAYLVAGEGDEPAAAVARMALERGSLGDNWVFGADGTDEPSTTLEPALVAIARSAAFAASKTGTGSKTSTDATPPATELATFLRQVGAGGEAHCVVFAPARSGPWVDAAMAAVRGFPGVVSFVLGTDGVDRQGPMPLWRRLLFVPEERPGITAEALSTLLNTLATAGGTTLVVDRENGRTYGEAHQRHLGAA